MHPMNSLGGCLRNGGVSAMRQSVGRLCAGAVFVVGLGGETIGAQELGPPWVEEMPGRKTTCAFDTPFRFFHNGLDGRPDLLIYFQGGGACWEWVSCSGMFDTSVSPGEITGYRGVFDRNNPDNPFRNFAIVFVPYCTGDVHIGDVVRQYGNGPSVRPVAHRGYRNVTAVFDWLEGRVHPSRIVVSGASAGSYAALFYTPEVTYRFPGSRVVLLGDSGLPLLHEYPDILQHWGAESTLGKIRRSRTPGRAKLLSLVEAHVDAAANDVVQLAQITSDRDAVQGAFYLISGSPRWREETYALLAEIAAQVPEFRSYVISGSDHGLLRTDRFYHYRSANVALRDWVSDLITGAPITNVRCDACTVP